LKRHQEDFDAGLKDVYSEELLMHFNAMDAERLKNAEQRELYSEQRLADERRIMGSCLTAGRFIFHIMILELENKVENLRRWIDAPNWTGPFEAAKSKRLKATGHWILKEPEYLRWLAQEVPYPVQGSIFAKNVLILSGMFHV